MINTRFIKTQREVIKMTNNDYLIEKITNVEEDFQKKLNNIIQFLYAGNISAICGMIATTLNYDYALHIAFVAVGVSSVIISYVIFKLLNIFDDMKYMNSKIVVKLIDEDLKKEVN